MDNIIGKRISRLLQSSSYSAGVVLEEFGDVDSIDLIVELCDGSYIQVTEYGYEPYLGDTATLGKAELVQDRFSLTDVEGRKIVNTVDSSGEFGLILDNELEISCQEAPGGNYPWISSS